MQQAMHRTHAPHPELQAELQQEYARIVPKVERSTIIKAESNASQTLKGQANGHAQPTSTIRRRQISPRSDSSNISSRATRQYGELRRDSGLESLEHIKDGMVESQAALALLSLSERHSPGRDGSIEPNYVDGCRFLSDAADAAPGNEGHDTTLPQPSNHAPTKMDDSGLAQLNNHVPTKMDDSGPGKVHELRKHSALPQANNHAPTNMDNSGAGKVHGLRRRKDSQSVT